MKRALCNGLKLYQMNFRVVDEKYKHSQGLRFYFILRYKGNSY